MFRKAPSPSLAQSGTSTQASRTIHKVGLERTWPRGGGGRVSGGGEIGEETAACWPRTLYKEQGSHPDLPVCRGKTGPRLKVPMPNPAN